MLDPSVQLKDPVLEVLLFRVGGVRYGVTLNRVMGLVRDLPDAKCDPCDVQTLLFEGKDVPVFPAVDFLRGTGPASERAKEAILFNDGKGLYGMAVDAADGVVDITPGDELYVLPPEEATEESPCRAWGVLTVAERPVILLDLSQIAVH
jgi:chemotaxis signal transduction protein